MNSTPRGIHLALHVRGAGASWRRDREPPLRLVLGAARAGVDQPRRADLRAVVSPCLGLPQALGVGARQPSGAVDPGQARAPTPFAERLLWAERQARVRMTPHVEALRRELQRVFALADDASPGGARARGQPRPRLADAADPRRSATRACTWPCASPAAKRRCAACSTGDAASPASMCRDWRRPRRCSAAPCAPCSSPARTS